MSGKLGLENLLRESITVLAFARAIRHEGIARLALADIAAVVRLGRDAVVYIPRMTHETGSVPTSGGLSQSPR